MSTEKEKTEQEEVTAPLSQAGDLLREARVKAGLSQQEIADRLRLKVSVIQSIDENNFELDQVATFTRGYLRSYAKQVSLDEHIVLNALDGVDEAQHKEHSMQSFSRKTNKEKHDRRIMKLTWGIFAVIIGISSIWWYQNQQDTITEVSEQDAAKALPAAAPSVSEPPSAPAAENQFETITEPVTESAEAVPAAEAPTASEPLSEKKEAVAVAEPTPAVIEEAEIAEPVAAIQEQTEAKDNTLAMSFSADCWIQIKDASGKTLATGVKKAGRTLSISGEPPYKIILGAPEGVTMTFASEPVDLSGYTSGKVARFTLP